MIYHPGPYPVIKYSRLFLNLREWVHVGSRFPNEDEAGQAGRLGLREGLDERERGWARLQVAMSQMACMHACIETDKGGSCHTWERGRWVSSPWASL